MRHLEAHRLGLDPRDPRIYGIQILGAGSRRPFVFVGGSIPRGGKDLPALRTWAAAAFGPAVEVRETQ